MKTQSISAHRKAAAINPVAAYFDDSIGESIGEVVADDFSTLVLDPLGRVRSCGESAERMFRMKQSMLIGMHAAALIPSLFREMVAAEAQLSQLINAAEAGSWHRHHINDAEGGNYLVDLCISRVVIAGVDIFLVNMHRQPGAKWN